MIKKVVKLKAGLEKQYLREFTALYKQIFNEYLRRYKVGYVSFNYQQFATEYEFEIKALLKRVYRHSRDVFGYLQRQRFKFNLMQVKSITTPSVEGQINERFDTYTQAEIENLTNTYPALIVSGLINVMQKQTQRVIGEQEAIKQKLRQEMIELRARERQLSVESANNASNIPKLERTRKKIKNTQEALEFAENNHNNIVKTSLRSTLMERAEVKAKTESVLQVGVAESAMRDIEVRAIVEQQGVVETGAFAGLSFGNLFKSKLWIATLDGRTRITHASLHGSKVPYYESFNVGGERLRYPRDPNGSAENVANCRCFLIYE